MTPVRLEPAALRSRVKHSTTEPLRSLTAMRSKIFFFTEISFDTFKEFSGVIFSVHLILPNVAECYLKVHCTDSIET